MPRNKSYAALIPVALLAVNVLVLVPMGWIVSRTLGRIEDLETTQEQIQLNYVPDREYRTDANLIHERLTVLEGRLYDIR